jgi:hypothetical protein
MRFWFLSVLGRVWVLGRYLPTEQLQELHWPSEWRKYQDSNTCISWDLSCIVSLFVIQDPPYISANDIRLLVIPTEKACVEVEMFFTVIEQFVTLFLFMLQRT